MAISELKERAKAQLGGNLFHNNWLLAVVSVLAVGAVMLAAAGISEGAATLILTGPFTYAICFMFLKQSRDNEQMVFSDLLCGFKDDLGQTLLIGLMTTIFTALWSLLFIIPGIVKAYSYSMAYYLKADHPEWNWKSCINESRAMMNGHKMDLFLLDLSFIGWYIVGALCLGIGTLWVESYHSATRAQFYNGLAAGKLYED